MRTSRYFFLTIFLTFYFLFFYFSVPSDLMDIFIPEL